MIHHHRRGQGAPATAAASERAAHFGRRHDGRLTAERLDFEEEAVTGNRDFKAERAAQAQREGRYEVKTGYTAHARPQIVQTETIDILNAWDAWMGAWRPVPPGPVYDLAVELIRRGELTCRIVGLLPLTGSQDEVLILREVREKRVWSVTLGCEVRVPGRGQAPISVKPARAPVEPVSDADLRRHPRFGFLVQAAKERAGGWIKDHGEFMALVREEYERLRAI